MKTDVQLDRNPLKGTLGDALHAVMCGAGHNINPLLKNLRHLPDGHLKLLHLWPVKLLQAGRMNYA